MTIKTENLFWRVVFARLKRRFIKNPIDKQLEDFLRSISANPDLKKVLTDKELTKVYIFLVKKVYDLGNFCDLYLTTIIPNQLKHIRKLNLYSQKSFYLNLFDKPKSFDDDIFEITRLGYIHLFHKYESFTKELVRFLNQYLSNKFNEQISIDSFLKKSLMGCNFFQRDNQPPTLGKINWICNCVKHRDGYPTLPDRPSEFVNVDESQQIKITPEEFGQDIKFMINQYTEIFQITLFIGYADYCIKVSRKSTAMDKKAVADLEAKLIAALTLRILTFSGKLPVC